LAEVGYEMTMRFLTGQTAFGRFIKKNRVSDLDHFRFAYNFSGGNIAIRIKQSTFGKKVSD